MLRFSSSFSKSCDLFENQCLIVITLKFIINMFFAFSLIVVFILLGLLIYKSEFFHASSDDILHYKDDWNEAINKKEPKI